MLSVQSTLWLIVSVLLGVLYSMGETAISVLTESRLRALIEAKAVSTAAANKVLSARTTWLLRMRTGRFLFRSVALVLVVHYAFLSHGTLGLWIGFFATYMLQALASEVGAATLRRLPGELMFAWLYRLNPLGWMMHPMAGLTQWTIHRLQDLVPIAPSEHTSKLTELEVEHVIEQGKQAGAIPQEEAKMLKSVLDFKDTVVREVMVPRTQVIAIALDTHLDRVLELFTREGHSRYPVYRDRIDHIEGVLYAKDLLKAVDQLEAASLVWTNLVRKSPYFVAESQKVSEVLREMQSRRVHLAIVVDEFGGTSGIVTLEDILEELVGEIRDEHDQEEAAIQTLEPQRFLVQADTSIHELHETLGVTFVTPQADYESLAGYMVQHMGHVPKPGECIVNPEATLTVVDSDERRIKKVEVRLSAPPPETDRSKRPAIRQSDSPSSL